MNDQEVNRLKEAVNDGVVIWLSDEETARIVTSVSEHSGEGPCANFSNGNYAALYNCHLGQFHKATAIQ